ncbi:MAG: DUF1840 domain-containing protein [Rhodocyclaceae bacterium]|nr:DUF1840 domain-containing protein [Rhodocyclaceae bacterium]MCP5232644.1 DUF1840 domain-containing protein [Zoogloeaceae bacterium]MCB1911711.1 DUF1840 domain-containing protein [Rhodocyclaceae bacterium]MCP5240662.1 DUF1840 domain-containing protein [Zoogloeaceae bacterium]MCP5253225.1 DUF1840 domain-containing protein [Zoogloeaceae bacterium]
MLIIFKSPASGDVIMFEKNGKEMLEIIGKDRNDAKGIVTVEQLPAAIGKLKAAVQEDKARQAEQDGANPDVDPRTGVQLISLAQRAVPLIELMEYSLRDKVPVTWGV